MKQRHILRHIVIAFALLLGTASLLQADITRYRNPNPDPAPRVEKRDTGFFSKLFGRRTENENGTNRDFDDDDDDHGDDDDDGDSRPRHRGPGPRFHGPMPGTTIITTTRTTQAPIGIEYSHPTRQYRAVDALRTPARPKPPAIVVSRHIPLVTPKPVPLGPLVANTSRVQTGITVVPPLVPAQPASRQYSITPPATPLVSHYPLSDTMTLQPVSQVNLPPSPRQEPAPLSTRVVQAKPPALTLHASADLSSDVGATSPDSQPANVPTAKTPDPQQPPPFGMPVPGRRGLVYPPGLSATPENMIDVTDIPPGTKVRDPVSKIVFRVP